MIFNGTVPVTLYAVCGWLEESSLNFSVDCGDSWDEIKRAVEKKYYESYLDLAESCHFQSGCAHKCLCSCVFDWDEGWGSQD